MYQAAVSEVVEGIKDQIRRTVKQNPSVKTVRGDLYFHERSLRKVMVFNGQFNKTATDYSVSPSNRWGGDDEVLYYDKANYGTVTSTLVFKDLYTISQVGGLINKSYAMQLTSLGKRFFGDIEKECRKNGIKTSLFTEFRMFFKGNMLEECAAIGKPLSPRAFNLQEMSRCISIKFSYSVSL